MTQKSGLSVCMIVKNEADNIAEALASFKSFADEIVVVDTGSRDNTKEIASRFTQRIFDFKWIDDFSAARNFAISKARMSYQLWLDADDRISPENQVHINSLKSHFDGRKAFYFVLENHQADSPVSSCLQLRCIPLVPGVKFEGHIHEQIFPSAVRQGLELVTTDIAIMHTGYMTLEVRRAKAARNLEILERERQNGANYGSLYFYLSLTHASLEHRDEAIRCMETALDKLQRENLDSHLIPEGYLFLARITLEMDDRDKCLRYLTKVGSLIDGSPLHNYQAGLLYQRLGRHTDAVACLTKVSGKSYAPNLFPTQALPSGQELLLHMAYSLYCGNDRQGALKLIRESAPDESQIGKSWEWMGVKAFVSQNMPLAQLAFETAIRFGDLEPRSWEFLASIYKLRGFDQKARECLQKAS